MEQFQVATMRDIQNTKTVHTKQETAKQTATSKQPSAHNRQMDTNSNIATSTTNNKRLGNIHRGPLTNPPFRRNSERTMVETQWNDATENHNSYPRRNPRAIHILPAGGGDPGKIRKRYLEMAQFRKNRLNAKTTENWGNIPKNT